MSSDFSVFRLVLEASVVVQLVILLLLLASIVSWCLIFAKRRDMNTAWRGARIFEDRFWSGIDLTQLYRDVSASDPGRDGLENIFLAGYREFSRLRQLFAVDPAFLVDGSRRAMEVALSREREKLDEQLPFLATVGSASPYVGLFGTVWGIMNSFRALGDVQQATLAMVAPGISEALIATAMGLFAAIPAVIAYNRYATRIERLMTRYENFLEEFSGLLEKEVRLTARQEAGEPVREAAQ